MYDLKQAGSRHAKSITPVNDGKREISFFDVKELYEIAYAEKGTIGKTSPRFELLMKRAEKLDAAYRTQLSLDTVTRYQEAA